MHPVVGQCPVCREAMTVTRLYCPTCDVTIEGSFSLEPLSGLTPEQLAFVEVFIRCEGKINRVEKVLDVSYPTVRSRLQEIIKALGYEIEEEPDDDEDMINRQEILNDLSEGVISIDEALTMLKD